MKAVRVQYTVKEEYVEQNKVNIRAVMNDLRENPISGMSYSTYYLGEGRFMHLNVMSDPNAGGQLNERQAFTDFRMALKGSGPLSPPNQEDLEVVGSNLELV